MTRTRHRRIRRGADEFLVVLVLLTSAYILYSVTESDWARAVVSAAYVATLGLAIRATEPTPHQRRLLVIVAASCGVVTAAAFILLPTADAIGVTDAVMALVLLITLVLVLSRVLTHRRVTLQTIAGALSAYLIIGMLFAAIYGVMAWRAGGDFFVSGDPADLRSLQYFSFTTLTTLGYGDFTAAGFPGRGVATFEALLGQVFMATLVARLVSAFRRPDDTYFYDVDGNARGEGKRESGAGTEQPGGGGPA